MTYNSLVIGSSSGIGAAIRDTLLKNNQNVIGISRRSVNITDLNYKHYSIDVTKSDFIKKVNNQIDMSSVNNLIYCVGTNSIKLAKECTLEDINSLLNINLIPAMLIAIEFSKTREIEIPSSILFLGSIWSCIGLPGRSIYGASKSALSGFSKHLSSELSPLGCLVNVLSPGFTNTPLTAKTVEDPLIQKLLDRVYKKNLLSTNAIASQALMLLKPVNSATTGQEIFSDGGLISHA